MNNPFLVGDVVYTPEGMFTVGDVKDGGCYLGKDTDHAGHKSRWYTVDAISFKPWAKPCHERPVQDGWWITTLKGEDHVPLLRKIVNGVVTYPHGAVSGLTHEYNLHKFIGTSWK